MDDRCAEARPAHARAPLANRRLTALSALAALVLGAGLAGGRFPARAASRSLDPASSTFFRPAINISHSATASTLPRSSPKSLVLDPHGPAMLFWVEAVPHTRGVAHELAFARFLPVSGWDTTSTPVGRWEGEPSTEPAVALDPGRNMHLVWLEQRGGMRMIQGLHFRLTTGEISPIEVISDSTYRAADPAVSADGFGHAHVVWSELDQGKSRIAYREWLPESGWGAIVRLPSVTGQGAFAPDVAGSPGGQVRVAWQETIGRGSRIGFVARAAGSASSDWQQPAQFLSDDLPSWYAVNPLIAQSPIGERAIAVWQASDGSASRVLGTDLSGATPGKPTVFAEGKPGARVEFPSAAFDGNEVLHLLWTTSSSSGPTVMYNRRAPGAPPDEPRPLTLLAGGPFDSPTIAADVTGRVMAMWVDRSHGDGDVMLRSGIASFGPPLTGLRHLTEDTP